MDKLGKKAVTIVKTLRDHGFDAYFVGGCVRNMIMNCPVEDYDIATSALPEKIQSIFPRTLAIGAQFGVILVLMDDDTFEVATFRKDAGYEDGRHPESVTFSDEREDVLRRDFTVNGLFYDPLADRIIDYVDGRSDIAKQIIRTIGEPVARFSEDRLRLMRAIRIACQLGFSIDDETWNAISVMARQICAVSNERIRDELVKTLLSSQPDRGIILFDKSGILNIILPEVTAMKNILQPPEFHPEGDVFEHTILMLRQMREPSVELALSVLFHDIGKPSTLQVKERIRFDRHDIVGMKMTKQVLHRLKFPRKQIQFVAQVVHDHMKFMHVRDMRKSTLKRFLNEETFKVQLELHRLDCLASHSDISNWEFCVQKMSEYEENELKPPRLVTGHDLIALGYTPGPAFSQMLRLIEDAQLEGTVTSKEDALDLVRTSFPLP